MDKKIGFIRLDTVYSCLLFLLRYFLLYFFSLSLFYASVLPKMKMFDKNQDGNLDLNDLAR